MEDAVVKKYDLAFSCGYACGVTQALRAANLQFASFPLDWVATPSFLQAANMIADGFRLWMERADLELVDVRRGGINKHIYRNRRTGFGFVHDFSSFRTFDENYPIEAEKYARRIDRLLACLARARTVLAVYAEWPKKARLADAELMEVRRVFQRRYPDAAFDLLYFYVKPGCHDPVPERIAEGIVAVGVDYRTFERGELHHQMENSDLITYLCRHVSVADSRTEAEKDSYKTGFAKQYKARWKGRNVLETLVNRSAFRLYRRLERFLIEKGLVPRERPLWFD